MTTCLRNSRMMRGSRQPPSGVTRKGVSHDGDAPHSCSGGNSNSSLDDRTFNCNINLDNVLDNTSFGGVQRPHDKGGRDREGVMLNSREQSCGECFKHSRNRRNNNRIFRGLLKSIKLVTGNMDIHPASKEAILEGYRAQLESFQRSSRNNSGAVRGVDSTSRRFSTWTGQAHRKKAQRRQLNEDSDRHKRLTGLPRKLANGKNISYNYPVSCITRGRKYCVVSNGKKPKSLSTRFMAAEELRAHKPRFELASTELFLHRWKESYAKEEPPRIELSPRPPVEGCIFD